MRAARTPSVDEFRAVLRGHVRDEADDDLDLVTEMILREVAGDLSWYSAQDLAASLPTRLARVVHLASFTSSGSRYAPQVMVARLADRQGVSQAVACAQVTAVLGLLQAKLPSSIWKKIEDDVPAVLRLLQGSPLCHIAHTVSSKGGSERLISGDPIPAPSANRRFPEVRLTLRPSRPNNREAVANEMATSPTLTSKP